MSREFPERPVLAVGAVVIRGEEVLLVKRGREPGLGIWSIPGGVVLFGEPLEEAVRREVMEETGIRVRPVCPLKTVERILPEGQRIRFHYIIVDYACVAESSAIEAGSDAAQAVWAHWNDLDRFHLSQETLHVLALGREVLLRGRTP